MSAATVVLNELIPDGSGASAIAHERLRQRSQEGFTARHDSFWDAGQLADAATVYLNTVSSKFASDVLSDPKSFGWPWHPVWYKPFKPAAPNEDRQNGIGEIDRIRCLEKAGALIAAEIDRLKNRK